MKIPTRIQTTTIVAAAAAILLTADARGSYSLYEDFQDLLDGYDISGNDPGENFIVGATNATTSGAFTVIADPTLSGNRLLQSTVVNKAFTGDLGALSVANNTTATLFYRIYRLGMGDALSTPDINFGLADDATPPSPMVVGAPYESQLNISGAIGAAQHAEFSPRDRNGTADTNVPFSTLIFYGIFQVIDSVNDNTQFYYQRATDPAPILLTGGDNIYSFRNGTPNANPLINFLMLGGTPAGAGAVQDTFYIDDIYLDTAGINLIAPVPIVGVPEPAAISSIALAACWLLGVRRSRRAA
jgi:hypothetical protein